jgi:Recombinase
VQTRIAAFLAFAGSSHPPKPFAYTATRWLLCNPAYIGKKEVNRKKRTLDQAKLPESLKYRTVDANWPPIVEKETFVGAHWELPGALARRDQCLAL